MGEKKMIERDIERGKPQENADDALIEQKRKDALLEQERMRRWIEDDEPLPVKTSCKLSQHIVTRDSK